MASGGGEGMRGKGMGMDQKGGVRGYNSRSGTATGFGGNKTMIKGFG